MSKDVHQFAKILDKAEKQYWPMILGPRAALHLEIKLMLKFIKDDPPAFLGVWLLVCYLHHFLFPMLSNSMPTALL